MQTQPVTHSAVLSPTPSSASLVHSRFTAGSVRTAQLTGTHPLAHPHQGQHWHALKVHADKMSEVIGRECLKPLESRHLYVRAT
jgi:hypothetical protein